ncbi:beta-lactamase family protein [Pseudomaricurvus alkylphenolicus]|uniref:serine hydrolase domain-containing protein n=1 Tax=Pseudomaricurvus alkylphenolicus TaxID=1306991 RepID=UPI00141DBE61|nr:serine hydrolase domain-containing protein [Pseudomaricurvus alkylphenolicus]NIB38171.1 beta-lactamase family protein [Pseudomaricurvus alkylphenolicus]
MKYSDLLTNKNPEELGFSPDRLHRIATTLEKAVKDEVVPGSVAIVGRKGHIAHCSVHGWQSVEESMPLGVASRFRLYSQTKPVIAVLALRLFEEGLFFLDDPVSRYLPEFSNRQVLVPPVPGGVRSDVTMAHTVPAEREITVFDLLTMTSGLPHFSTMPATYASAVTAPFLGTGMLPGLVDDKLNNPPQPFEQMILSLANLPLQSQPGECWSYGHDFDVLGLLLERVTGQSLETLCDTHIFQPLGMGDTGFYCPESDVDTLTAEYQWDDSGAFVLRDAPSTAEKLDGKDRKLISANGMFGGLLSSPRDFSLFAQMLLNSGELNGERILGRKTIDLMTANHIGGKSVNIMEGPHHGFGFGVSVRKQLGGTFMPVSAGAYGWSGAGGTYFVIDPIEDMFCLFFTHVFLYPMAAREHLQDRVVKMAYEALT